MANAVTSKTFCNRYTKCYYYIEKDTYIKYIDIFFHKLLIDHQKKGGSLLEIFSEKFNSASYTGIRFIYKKDRESYKEYCIKCVTNLNAFLKSYQLIKIYDQVIYKDKIKCYIGGIISDKKINVHFCFKSLTDSQKNLDFHLLNNYIYNKMHDLDNSCLIFNVPSDTYFLVESRNADYTTLTRKGFLKSIINSRIKRQGEYCITCKLSCKPMFINQLARLNAKI